MEILRGSHFTIAYSSRNTQASDWEVYKYNGFCVLEGYSITHRPFSPGPGERTFFDFFAYLFFYPKRLVHTPLAEIHETDRRTETERQQNSETDRQQNNARGGPRWCPGWCPGKGAQVVPGERCPSAVLMKINKETCSGTVPRAPPGHPSPGTSLGTTLGTTRAPPRSPSHRHPSAGTVFVKIDWCKVRT